MSDKFVPLSKEDAYRLIKDAQKGDQEAKSLLIQANTGLVKKIASKFAGFGCDMEDLVQIGFMGLIKAVDKFDPSFDVMFSTYAVPMIMGEIKRFLRDDGAIKAGRALKSQVYALRKAEEAFVASKGVRPRISQLAEILGISKEEVFNVMEADKSLSGISSLDDEGVLEEPKNNLVCNSPEGGIDKMVVRGAISKLPQKEKEVIYLRYFKDFTQSETGRIVGVSQVQVSRLEKRALKFMKENIGNV